jgi:hypothetical protein
MPCVPLVEGIPRGILDRIRRRDASTMKPCLSRSNGSKAFF